MKRWLVTLGLGEALQKDLGLLLLRLWFGGTLALLHGVSKFKDLKGFTEVVARLGIPQPTLTAVFAASSELLGGLLLALGLFTRGAALSIAGTLSVAAFWVHGADPFAKKEFALLYVAGALTLCLTGPGRFSLDGQRK